MQANTLNTNDILDVRGLIDRSDELVNLLENEGCEDACELLRAECALLADILADLRGNGGDEEWCGDWYPVTLIRDSYFKTYAQELAEECGMIDRTAHWPNTCIDWAQAALELQHDYTPCEIDGVTYWYR